MIAPPDFLEIADAFCGAGGSSTGLRIAMGELGLSYRLGVLNHWDIAIATHKANHPDAHHIRANAYKVRAAEIAPSGRLDLLIASPTCTFFSRSRGGKPISWDQRWGRMTPTQVIRFVNEIDVRRVLVENVPEIRDWGPVHRGPKVDEDGNELEPAPPIQNERCLARNETCKPSKRCAPGKACQRRKGSYFRSWLARLERAGFRYEYRVLCSADFGDPTTRERFYLIGTREAEPIEWPSPTHSEDGGDLFGELPRWRAARECIDFKIRGRSIFNRKKRLSTKTLERIYAGCVRYGWPRPFLLKLRAYIDRKPLPTFTAADFEGWLAPAPLVARSDMHKSNALCVRSADEPVATVTTGGGLGLVEPLLVPQGSNSAARPASEPVPTVVAIARVGLVEPLVMANRTNNVPRPASEPMPTITTTPGGGGIGLVQPLILNRHGSNGGCRASSVDAPLPTATCSGAGYLIEPFVDIARANARGSSLDEPLRTVCAGGTHLGLEPLVLPQGGGGVARPTTDPLPTLATDGAVGLIVPYYGTGVAKDLAPPLPTVTTRDRFGLVVPVAHAGARRARSTDDPLPTVTGAHRGDLAFIAASFGERQGQAPRTHSLDAPMPTVCAGGSIRLVQGDPVDVDILFRMLEPHELAAAMGFPEGYRFVSEKKEDLTRQIGNAVSVNTAAALVRAIFGGARRRAVA